MNDAGEEEKSGSTKGPYGTPGDDYDIICEAKERYQIAISAEADNYKAAQDDLEFLKGDQWPALQKRQREADGKPCLTINKIPTFLQQVTNDQRQNRADIKVSAASEESNNETALTIQGMIKAIEYDSSADVAYDTATNSAAAIGFGYWRLITEYEDPMSFNQVIKIKRIRNSFTVHGDPGAVEADGSDSKWWLISEKLFKKDFEQRYPKAELTSNGFNISGPGESNNQAWLAKEWVRVAEYYRIEFEPAKICMLSNGEVIDKADKNYETLPEGIEIIAERDTVRTKVMWYLMTPCEILDRAEIKCKWIPVFPVYGTEIDSDGEVYRSGLIRNAKDPAMMYNFWMTSATEEVAMRSKTPFIGPAGSFEGYEKKWQQANTRNWPYLEYNPQLVDGQMAPPPSRQPMADVPQGVLAMAMHASDNIKQTTGLFDSSLGSSGSATSGKQELAQQKQGSVTNSHYFDNFIRSLRQCGRCLIDMIPHYYDTQRIVQCRGDDGTISPAVINKWDAAAEKWVNDVRVGRYQVAVVPGPSYATMRAEAADAMIQFGQSWPKLMDIAGDVVVKAMNWPGAEKIADRIEKTIPANLKEEGDGQPQIPPEVQQQIEQLKQQAAELQEAADKNKADIERERIKAKAQVETADINAESRSDVAELNGLVKLLIAKLAPPPALSANVNQDLAESDNEGTQQVPQIAPVQQPGMPPMNDIPSNPEEY